MGDRSRCGRRGACHSPPLPFCQLPPLAPAAAAKARARFWELLGDFAELGQPHKSWDGLAEQGHPFLVRSGEGVAVVVPP